MARQTAVLRHSITGAILGGWAIRCRSAEARSRQSHFDVLLDAQALSSRIQSPTSLQKDEKRQVKSEPCSTSATPLSGVL
ncbi:hypothetical protein P154DRAFT_360100 [Amniculicola lignicola CBS 123094]|uniref:Uncharacterized protein n=1 Tax=Amniculicola lignicola CBS 123094 TaxID=1392246 RepID=A0A6A5W7B0_9PLEO|nr:hypothetical protein P154DRAFT_360100 [Amniculicola lignicola CBS 123094]